MKKYVICIPASDDFALAAAVLIHSIKKNLRLVDDCDFVVPYNNLNEASMNLIRKAHSETMFKPPRNSDFYKHIPRTIYGVGNFDVYLSFETFSQIGYERSIYLDADMLCTGDFSDIVEDEKQIIWKFPNLGILVVGDKYLTGQAYDEMVKAVVNTLKTDPMAIRLRVNTSSAPPIQMLRLFQIIIIFKNLVAVARVPPNIMMKKQTK